MNIFEKTLLSAVFIIDTEAAQTNTESLRGLRLITKVMANDGEEDWQPAAQTLQQQESSAPYE